MDRYPAVTGRAEPTRSRVRPDPTTPHPPGPRRSLTCDPPALRHPAILSGGAVIPMRYFVRTVWLGALILLATTETRADFFQQTNLVSNQPNVARLQDPNLVNPWGVSFSPMSPFWVSNNGTGTSTLYS